MAAGLKTTLAAALVSALWAGCAGIPKGVEPVTDFDLERYLGTWYEIARLDHRFERGLTDISATYRLRDDGGIEVVNRGYSVQSAEWRQATGKAYLVGDRRTGRLKVSFFGPFYGGYNIFALDHDNYEYAMIAGPNRSYLWILARRAHLPPGTIDQLIAKAERLGFATDELIFVEHGNAPHTVATDSLAE
jgi:apolipoprotein D and lipocalin family protein